jgi:hypothetical protein
MKNLGFPSASNEKSFLQRKERIARHIEVVSVGNGYSKIEVRN